MNENIVSDYRIGEKTLVLMQCKSRPHVTKVIEKHRILYVAKQSIDLIKQACLRDGWASYEGKRAAVQYNMGFKYKVPIPVIPHLGLFFFPTHGMTNPDNMWINPNAIERCEDGEFAGVSIMHVGNGVQVEVELERNTLHVLYMGAIRCQHVFNGEDPFVFV